MRLDQSDTWQQCQSECCCFQLSRTGWRLSPAARSPSGRWIHQTLCHHFWGDIEICWTVRRKRHFSLWGTLDAINEWNVFSMFPKISWQSRTVTFVATHHTQVDFHRCKACINLRLTLHNHFSGEINPALPEGCCTNTLPCPSLLPPETGPVCQSHSHIVNPITWV